ncbi:MAG: hypothetical protein HUJ30_02785 [Gammaproteobacteria bacterium]|nr:hypothetical protein [Gammaproteobacteria bacterium]
MNTPDDEGFLQLWPTTILQRRLPGHEMANTALVELIEQLEAGHDDLTTDYLSDNFMTIEHPVAQWLKDCNIWGQGKNSSACLLFELRSSLQNTGSTT